VNVPIRQAVAARIVSDQGVILGKSKEEMLKNLKNIAKPVEVYAIQLDGAVSPGSRFLAAADLKQEIRYCKAPDGVVPLAYATAGSGPPLLRSAHWLGHLEYDWEMPILSAESRESLGRVSPQPDPTLGAKCRCRRDRRCFPAGQRH
jgi:hypothetical protein